MEIDYITSFISSLNNGFLTGISTIVDNDLVFGSMLIVATLIGERRPEKIKKIVLALILTFVISTVIKEMLKVNRPCTDLIDQKIKCPHSYSFPSIHTALSFTLAISFLNKKGYFAYLMFAIFVSFTRIYLLAHTFVDISGGMIVAGVSYYLLDLAIGEKKYGKKRTN